MWEERASDKHEIEYIMSIDVDEPDSLGYATNTKIIKESKKFNTLVLVNENRSIVDAVNRGAHAATGDMLVVMSDDFECPPNWDYVLQTAVEFFGNSEYLIMVDDCVPVHQKLDICTLPVLSRSWFQKYGYVYYPEYFSMFCDNDMTLRAKRDHVLLDVRHLISFQHNHFICGRNPKDETYTRETNADAFRDGEILLNTRVASGFVDTCGNCETFATMYGKSLHRIPQNGTTPTRT